MGQKFRTGNGPDQAMLMPADPREWLPPDHLAWRVIELAGEMDLTAFGAGYRADGQGGRPYDPQMMATLLLYCYCRGRRSSREIELATFDDVGARIICGGLHPDHSTAAEFTRRNRDAVLALLPESVKACAREGLVSLEVVAGDGTKLKANASMAANLTGEQLDAQIAELEAWIDAEVRGWVQDMLDGEGTAPAGAGAAPGDSGPGDSGPGDGGPGDGGPGDGGPGDGGPGDGGPGDGGPGDGGPGDGGPGDGGGKRRWKKKPPRAAQMLAGRRAARVRLDTVQDKDQGRLDARVAELAARIGKKEAAVRRWEAAAGARIEARAARIAAGERIPGTRPIASAGEDRQVKAARQALDKTCADWQAACREAAAPAADPDAKVNPTDPSSLVMPLKKGGFDQLFNVQALATARTQVILAITRHASPVDVQALEALLAQARHVLCQAGITDQILKALFDAGYASDANFTLDIPEMLYIAVTRESRQTGRTAGTRVSAPSLPSWQDMTARLQTSEGKALYKQRAATIEPVFAQLTARLGRTLHYRGDLADAELAFWAASHNILKAITARGARLARQARTAPAPAVLAA
jgi:transposase